MAKFDVDGEFIDNLKAGVKQLMDVISSHQQKDGALTALAEHHARMGGAPPEHMDAHVYMHKKALKKAISDHQKAMTGGQGGPGAVGFQAGSRPANMPMQAPQGVVNKQRMMQSVGGPSQAQNATAMQHMNQPGQATLPNQRMMGPARGPMAGHMPMPGQMAPPYQGNVLPRSPGASSQ